VVQATATSIFNSTTPVTFGGYSAHVAGLIGVAMRAEIRNGIDGTVVASPNLGVLAPGETSTVDEQGNTWAVAGAPAKGPDYPLGADLDEGAYISTPHVAAYNVTDLDIAAYVAPQQWSADTVQTLASKWEASAGQASWSFGLDVAGHLQLIWQTAGGIINTVLSTIPVPMGDQTAKAVRAMLDVNPGTVTFQTSDDGSNWTQLGAAIATGVTSIINSTAALRVGAIEQALNWLKGIFYWARLRGSIGGAVVAEPILTAVPAGAPSFVDPVARVWTPQVAPIVKAPPLPAHTLLGAQFRDDDGEWQWVWEGWELVPDPITGEATVMDYEPTFGVRREYRGVSYIAATHRESQYQPPDSAVVLGPRNMWALTCPADHSLDLRVRVRGEFDFDRTVRQGVFAPVGRKNSVIVNDDNPLKGIESTLQVYALDETTYNALEALAESGQTLLLRDPLKRSWYVQVSGVNWSMQRAGPNDDEVTPIRHAHFIDVGLIESDRPRTGPVSGDLATIVG
jgi:hypothetical protein